MEKIILGWIVGACIFFIGYGMGQNETRPPPAYDLPESIWQEIHSYRMCMQDRSCRMFVIDEK